MRTLQALIMRLSFFSHSFIVERILTNQDEEQHSNTLSDDVELLAFDLDTIMNATENFSSANEIGKGGFGPVYKVLFWEHSEFNSFIKWTIQLLLPFTMFQIYIA